MKIVLGADHGGFELKEVFKKTLLDEEYYVVDIGCDTLDAVDYPDIAHEAVSKLLSKECDLGILICGTGIGMSIAANRNRGIRAANCHDEFTAKMSREHNDANILCIGARVLDEEMALKILMTWLAAEFTGGRHQVRISKFSD